MLTHRNEQPCNPARVVVMGAGGFVGRALCSRLEDRGIATLPLTSRDIDLCASDAADALAARLEPTDSLVMLSALTPDKGRDVTAFLRNIVMAQAVCDALGRSPVAHAVYISSDAVYAFDRGLVSESTPPSPTDLYGCMHRTREILFQGLSGIPVAVLRPTLIYGAGDTHNSYGPNRFRRLAAKEGRITLGGEGEETRDHIHVGDAAELIARTLVHQSTGCLNLVTGRSVSFLDLARMVVERLPKPAEVATTPRTAPITHRAFDVTACRKAFPDFVFTPLETGLVDAQKDLEV